MKKWIFLPALLISVWVIQPLKSQIPVRNFIYQSLDEVEASLNEMELPFDTYEENWDGSGASIYAYPPVGVGSSNSVAFSFLQDSCYRIQYDFYDGYEPVYSLQRIMEDKETFSPCLNMKYCWMQQAETGGPTFVWNLFFQYQGVEDWGVLIIEDLASFNAQAPFYQKD